MIIATVSLEQIWEDKKANLVLCEEYLKYALKEKVDLVVFPEMTLTGFSTNTNLTAEQYNTSNSILKFKNLAKLYSIAIVFGVVIKDENKALNKSVFINSSGEILGEYVKIHPFTFSGEDKYFNAGDKLKIVKFNDTSIGLTICYDLRFSELYSVLAKQSDIIINIANWPEKRVEHWDTLLKARAIENQLYIIGVNRTGTDANKLSYKESSCIYNANGDLEKFNQFKNMKIFEIDKNFTKEFKSKFNTTNDRKVELYKEML